MVGLILEKSNDDLLLIINHFVDYCNEKNYQIDVTDIQNAKRLDISNLSEKTIVLVYSSSKVLVQGKSNELKKEITLYKDEVLSPKVENENDTQSNSKSRIMTYHIILPKLQDLVQYSIEEIYDNITFIEQTDDKIKYRMKVAQNHNTVMITQYNNGTLLVQGRECLLFNDCCDIIEKTANPDKKEIISRFVPDTFFIVPLEQSSIEEAEDRIKTKIGNVYNYLERHDKNWFISSEFLCSLNLPLPEYSPLVMPASKAFEGFCKKVVVDLGLYESDHFKKKGASFSRLKDTTNGNRKIICGGYKYGDTMLKILDVGLDEYRNFMMHSDDEEITKVNTKDDAVELVNSIIADTKKVFDYFNKDSDLL
jgi:hypothetical protein